MYRGEQLRLVGLGYEDRLRALDMLSLTYRRVRKDYIEMHKLGHIKYGSSKLQVANFRELITRGNQIKDWKGV